MTNPAPTHALVHPQPGVRLYAGGKHAEFEPGRAVRIPADHAALLQAAGHVRPHTDETATPSAQAGQPAAPAPEAAQPAAPVPAPVSAQPAPRAVAGDAALADSIHAGPAA